MTYDVMLYVWLLCACFSLDSLSLPLAVIAPSENAAVPGSKKRRELEFTV